MSAEAQRRYNERHPGRHAETMRRFRARNPEYVRRDIEAARERMAVYAGTARGMLTRVRANASRRSDASKG